MALSRIMFGVGAVCDFLATVFGWPVRFQLRWPTFIDKHALRMWCARVLHAPRVAISVCHVVRVNVGQLRQLLWHAFADRIGTAS